MAPSVKSYKFSLRGDDHCTVALAGIDFTI